MIPEAYKICSNCCSSTDFKASVKLTKKEDFTVFKMHRLTHFSIWNWRNYAAYFCTDCVFPFEKFMKEKPIISYAHFNYKRRE